MVIMDCTLRDGGYYNSWDFPVDVINDYLEAMEAAAVDIVELGLRSGLNKGFKGACAYTTDNFLGSLFIPEKLRVAVMVNAVELLGEQPMEDVLAALFPLDCAASRVDVVRVACHVHEFEAALPASSWLKDKGYQVGFNLMQVADRSREEVESLSLLASTSDIDVLYFADSMGSMDLEQTSTIINWLRQHWQGDLGIHTHDNMGMALQNTLQAAARGVTWLDATVTGMGRGPGNAKTEYLVIEAAEQRGHEINLVPLSSIISREFRPMQNSYGWGTNAYYYLAGKFGIHPTFIQEMMNDSRYTEEDILAAIEHLKVEGGKKFSFNALDASRHFYRGDARGRWNPADKLRDREVLILGAGQGIAWHRAALTSFIRGSNPLVIALNTQSNIEQSLVDIRVACHPVRLLADCEAHTKLPQPLVTPESMLPPDVLESLQGKTLLDYGLTVEADKFDFGETTSVLPNSLVISYALAIASSGKARRIYLAGFDGYGAGDPRTGEMQHTLSVYHDHSDIEVISITPTTYTLTTQSVYGLKWQP